MEIIALCAGLVAVVVLLSFGFDLALRSASGHRFERAVRDFSEPADLEHGIATTGSRSSSPSAAATRRRPAATAPA